LEREPSENMNAEVIKEGDYVVLYIEAGKKHLVKVTRGREFHTHRGYIKLSDLIGKKYGDYVISNVGSKFYLLKPTPEDYVMKVERVTQIIYPKDIGLIILRSGVGPGSIVVEAGTGSGALTGALAYYVRPHGRVYSYEIRKEFLERARRNLEKLGLINYVVLKHKDITKGIDERYVDAVILDLATPWLVVGHAHEALKGGGAFVSFSPTIDQVIRTVEELRKYPFVDITVSEIFLRNYKVKRGETRPETFMVGHTGYVVFARKVNEF